MGSIKCLRPCAELTSELFDLIVIGGGCTGAGVAQDAASRGLRTLLIEKGDFASGTSSKSTKLIHGGLRYLENLQFMVTLESVRERQLQQMLAPHMVWSLPFVIPVYRGNFLKNLKTRAGLTVYDLMAAGFSNLKRHHSISAEEVVRLCPGIDRKGLTGGLVYYDCRTDDARHTLAVTKSACDQGAVALNYTRVVRVGHEDEDRQIPVEVVDAAPCAGARQTANYILRAHCVVNATGVWTGQLYKLAGVKSDKEVVPAKGIHITVSDKRLPLSSALIVPSVHDRRFCFAIPWYGSIVIGTTDTAYHGDLDHVRVEPEEVRYLLDAVNARFPALGLREADITGSYAGLRPLIKEAGKASTADLSRQHQLQEFTSGLISISGGKLTTYRPMAAETVDLVVKRLKRLQEVGAVDRSRRFGPSRTHELMLGGWQKGDDVAAVTAAMLGSARELGLAAEIAGYLPQAYGKDAFKVLKIVSGDRRLGERLSPHHPYILAQVLYAIWAESALTVDDVLSRRIRLAITDRQAALAASRTVADIMQQELGWTAEQKAAQLDHFRREWV